MILYNSICSNFWNDDGAETSTVACWVGYEHIGFA